MQKFTAAKIKCIGGKVGIFYGLDENELKAILDNVMSRISHLSEQTRNGIEDLLTEKMQAILLEVNLAGRHTAESLRTQIKQNCEGLEEKLFAFIADVVAANTADVKEYIAAQTRLASSEAAKAVLRLNDIETALTETKDTARKTYEEILKESLVLRRIETAVDAHRDNLTQQIGRLEKAQEKTKAELVDLIKGCFKVFLDGQYDFLRTFPVETHDDIVYAVQYGERKAEKQMQAIQKEIEAGDPSEILRGLENLKSQMHVEHLLLHKDHDNIEAKLQEVLDKLHERYKHGEDCPRCNAPESRIYKCDVCGFDGDNKTKPESVWSNFPPNQCCKIRKNLLLIKSPNATGRIDLQRIYFEMLCDHTGTQKIDTFFSNFERILFHSSVKEILIKDSRKHIRYFFPKLKTVGWVKPADGKARYVLGEALFSGCKDLVLYGTQYLKDAKAHCFKGWFANASEVQKFLEKAPILHREVSNHEIVDDWRT